MKFRKYRALIVMLLGLSNLAFSQGFYNINTINTIEITFEESNWDYILDQLYAAGDEERLIGTVIINGEFFDSVGVRYKGNSTYQPNQVKNPLNIKLDHVIDDQTIEGYGTLKLANCYNDPSFMREVLSYEIARKYFPASSSNYANVYINGTHLGLYSNDQSVDKYFLQTHIGDDDNTRVKGEINSTADGPPTGGVWEYFGEDSTLYSDYYEIKSDYGWNELINMLYTLNNQNEYLDVVLNVDRHIWFLAFSNLVVNLDGPINNPQNYYLFRDNNARFNTIPWDFNESFGVFSMHQTLGNLNTTQKQQLSPFANLNESEFPVISKVLNNITYRKMYVAHMKTIIEENFSDGQYEERAYEIQNIINADVQNDNNKFYTYNDFLNNVTSTAGGGGWPPSPGILGLTELMDARTSYILSLTDFQYEAPLIDNVQHIPANVSPGEEVWITADIENETEVTLAYRTNSFGIFNKIAMYDDGMHEDGEADDGTYGTSITAPNTNVQYYIYSENDYAAAFLPVRAEYEFFEISISGDLVINEFMADNESYITDQDGEYDDWIEFYNNGDSDINLEGYFLSDDGSEPDKWMFPDTIIYAGDYLIVWADKDEEQSGLHADIKLSADGEMIVLSDNNLNIIDEINFGLQKADTSTGRYPNGTGDFMEMLPTFEMENNNILAIEENTFATNFELFQNFPNPFSDYTNITFQLEDKSEVTIDVYSLYGQKISTLYDGSLPAGEHTCKWNARGYPGGVYTYTLRSNGTVKTRKMVVQ
jgi:spore coat protein CotH